MRPPKFIPTCDSILIPNVASTLQWKRRRIRRVAWYAEDNFNVNPTSSLSCHVSCADFSRRRALFLPLTRRPATGIVGRLPRPPLFVVCATSVHVFYRTSVRSNVCSLAVWRVVWYRAGTFLCMRSCPCPSWPSWSRRGCGRAVAWPSCPGHRDVAVARRGRGCGVRSLCVAFVWLRHADEC